MRFLRPRGGAFLGDVSALALLPDGDVLVGSGPSLHWHRAGTGQLRSSTPLFEGARVHGLRLAACGGSPAVHAAVHGGRRVALLRLLLSDAAVRIAARLPPFAAWVLDVRLLQAGSGDDEPPAYLAVGLSDNSVELWDTHSLRRLWRCTCSVRALLYSLALHGASLADLTAASGTIFNEVLLWRPADAAALLVDPAARLGGHEGSVHRLVWSCCGTRLASVSDDRTARVWAVEDGGARLLLPPFYGHAGRLWDAAFLDDTGGTAGSPTMLATAGEDCSARLWRLTDGTCIATLAAHAGRGVWRCAGGGGMLVTGGADGGVKRWRLADWQPGQAGSTFAAVLPSPCEGAASAGQPRDSRSDFVRCVAVPRPDLVLLATNRGLLFGTRPVSASQWSPPLARMAAPIACMRCSVSGDATLRVLLGDLHGGAAVVDISVVDGLLQGHLAARWDAHVPGKVMAAFWLDLDDAGAQPGTADALGKLSLWRLAPDAQPALLAAATLPERVLSAAARDGLILCGDQRGGVSLLALTGGTLALIASQSHAHAAAALTLVQRAPNGGFVTAGGDGCLCGWTAEQTLTRTFRRHEPAITAVEALCDTGGELLAAGITSDDIVLVDLAGPSELARVSCGGWRRPHAILLGCHGSYVAAFARDGALHVRQRWAAEPAAAAQLAVRPGHHGREIHAALFVPPPSPGAPAALVTGAEDGALYCCYLAATQPLLDRPGLLAQSAGGTAIRALSLVPHPVHGWVLLAAGAKEVLSCFQLRWQGGTLCCSELCARTRPGNVAHIAWRAGEATPHSAEDGGYGDQRYMSLAGFTLADALCAAVGSSDGTLCVWVQHSDAAEWRLLATLQSASSPSLALAAAPDAAGAWLVAGGTDGTLRFWRLGAKGSDAPLAQSLVLLRVHQSGVNCVALAPAPAAICAKPHAWLLHSGGDDGALVAMLFILPPAGTPTLVAAARRPDAHASGIKGVWGNGDMVSTAALDQRVALWRTGLVAEGSVAEPSPLDMPWLALPRGCEAGDVDMGTWWEGAGARLALERADVAITEVADVEAVCALAAGASCAVAVVGRGVQALLARTS